MTDLRERFTTPSINTLFANARLTQRALIIVEGVDDIQFYSRIGKSINKSFIIQAIENINGYSEGCDQVIKLTEDFQELYNEEEINKKYFLSIIDNDVRQFRGEQVDFDGLFTLKHYSFESHYVTSENIKKLILDLTNADYEMLNEDELNNLREDISIKITDNLYLPSLDSLKNALEEGYDNLVGYSTAIGAVLNNQVLLDQLKEREENLSRFATELGLEKNFETIRNIAKGKWVLTSYSKNINRKVKELNELCRQGHINQCQYCSNGNSEKCMYKMQMKPQEGILTEMIKNTIDYQEIQYIIDRLSELN